MVAGRTVLLGMLAVGLVLVLIAAIFVIRTVGFGHRHHNPVDPPAPAASAGAPGGYTSGW